MPANCSYSHYDSLRLNLFQRHFQSILKDFKSIEVSGFPAEGTFDRVLGKQYTSSTKKASQSLVLLSQVMNSSFRVLFYEMSTLKGNSGSPIFQKIQQKNRKSIYQFGVHTNGKYRNNQQQAQFMKTADPNIYKKQKYPVFQYNSGTYLYSKNIYEYLLRIPGIHTVISKYQELMSHIVVIQYESEKNQFGLGLLLNKNMIAVSNETKSLKAIYYKSKDSLTSQANILQLNLADQQAFEQMTIKNKNLRLKSYGFQFLTVKFWFDYFQSSLLWPTQQKFEETLLKTVHLQTYIDQKSPYISQSQSKGLAIGIKGIKQGTVQLDVEAFDIKNMLKPNISFNSAFLFAYDFQKEKLIWSYFNKSYQDTQNVIAQQKQYFSRVVALKIATDFQQNPIVCTANLLYDNKDSNCKYLITAASNLTPPQFVFNNRTSTIQDIKQIIENSIQYKFFNGQFQKLNISDVFILDQYLHKSTNKVKIQTQGAKIKLIKRNSIFDIALIKIENPISTNQGFRIKRIEKYQLENLNNNVKTVGYNPVSDNLVITNTATAQIIKFDESLQMIKHFIQTEAGFGGCAISHQNYLYGVHALRLSQSMQNSKIAKLATYIYQPQVYSWIQSIIGKENIMD